MCRPSVSSSTVARQVSSASLSTSLPAAARSCSNKGFLNEKMNIAVSSALNPCSARERETPSRNSRSGLNSPPEMSAPLACSAAWVSRLRNSPDCCSISAAPMRPLPVGRAAARSRVQADCKSLPLFFNTLEIMPSAITRTLGKFVGEADVSNAWAMRL